MLASHARSLPHWMCGLALGSFVLACGGPARPEVAPARVQPERAQPEGAAGNPLQSLAPVDAAEAVFAGVVAESLAAGGYTYLRVTTDEGDRWVATMGKGAPVGHRVHVKNMGTRHDFHSKRLDRRFDVLAFGIVREA